MTAQEYSRYLSMMYQWLINRHTGKGLDNYLTAHCQNLQYMGWEYLEDIWLENYREAKQFFEKCESLTNNKHKRAREYINLIDEYEINNY